MIDVSFNAQKSGVMYTSIAALRSVIEHLDESQNHHVKKKKFFFFLYFKFVFRLLSFRTAIQFIATIAMEL